MAHSKILTTKEKALAINLNPDIYGSFAEIGAGQEIAAHFFRAGGASGTIAKTMSAYDMSFSDAIYGKTSRYVSRERLMTMLHKEYVLLRARLPERTTTTRFFAMADTIETLNFTRSNRGQGWIGVRYQLEPEKEPNDCIMHINLNDSETEWQQEAVGILGVNVLYACFFAKDSDHFLDILLEQISSRRIEVDMLSFTGPDFESFDNRLLSLKLVKKGMSQVAMFGPDGKNVQPSEILYKKHILMMRGRFRPVTHVNLDMLASGKSQFIQDEEVDAQNVKVIWELTLHNLRADGKIDEQDFLDRVDILCSLGQTVMISNYQEYYKLVSYLSHFVRNKKIGILLGIINLQAIFDEQYYQDMRGGILEAFGILFGANIKIYVYPALHPQNPEGELYTCAKFQLQPDLFSLFQYLKESGKIEDIIGVDRDILAITSDKVISMIKSQLSGWEEMVPEEVGRAIKKNRLFGYKEREEQLN